MTGSALAASARAAFQRWQDPALAAGLLVVCAAEVTADRVPDRAAAVDALLIVGMTLPVAYRRRAPLVSAVAALAVLVAVVARFGGHEISTPQLMLFVVPYSVATYSERWTAGLAACLTATAALNAVNPSGASSVVFSVGSVLVSFAIGRMVRARRVLTEQLRRTTEEVAAGDEVRERLLVTEQRGRIARELQALTAEHLSAMVVHTGTARRLLERDDPAADEGMAVIETLGRQALGELRRILGVLRRPDERAGLSPQPGVDRIPALLAERTGARTVLQVEGDTRPLPPGVDLEIYRLLEDALDSLNGSGPPDEVRLRFTPGCVELHVTGTATAGWPSAAMIERVALCDGDLDVRAAHRSGRLVVRLPTGPGGAEG